MICKMVFFYFMCFLVASHVVHILLRCPSSLKWVQDCGGMENHQGSGICVEIVVVYMCD